MHYQDNTMDISKHEYLEKVLESHKMKHINDFASKHTKKRDDIKTELQSNYTDKVYTPINSGSFAKHTAINIKFDLDIVVPFKKDAFNTLEEMFNSVYDFLYEKYQNEAIVRKQKVSIGLEFYPDSEGETIKLDIVPGRELNLDQYSEDKKLNLYVNSQYGILEEKSYIQTNIQAQIDHITAKKNERMKIRLLKAWKHYNNEQYKSFLLELLVVKAFDKEDINGNLWDKLKQVMEYIKDNINQESFNLKDPGNSGNNVVDTLNSDERQRLSNTMKRIVENIEENDDNIKIYFPINKQFEENETQRGYGLKTASASVSIPPNNTRFGLF
jgi:hypothetical protein